MAFKHKTTADTKWLNDPVTQAQKSQHGNSDVDLSNPDYCYSSGLTPVNASGQVTNKTGRVMNWPYQRFTVDNELNPKSNQGKPDQLSTTPQAFGDYTADGKMISGIRDTLG